MNRILAATRQDVWYALRGLRMAPGYTTTLLLTLALGLCATTTMFAIVDSVLLHPVRLTHPEQLLVLSGRKGPAGITYDLGAEQISSLGRYAHSFTAVSVYRTFIKPVDAGEGPRIVLTTSVTPDIFDTLGTTTERGRVMNDRDADAPVVIVSHSFWQDQLRGRRDVIGSTIKLDRQLRTVIGVLPQALHFPQGTDFPTVYSPIHLRRKQAPGEVEDGGTVLARLRPGVSRAQAVAEASSVLHFAGGHGTNEDSLRVTSYQQFLTGNDERLSLLVLLGGGCVLLLIACANAANLQLARLAGRTAELRTRLALGAGFGRLSQQLVTESVITSLIGATLGGLLTFGLLALTRKAYGRQFARFDELAVHPSTVITCFLLAILAGVLASLMPARWIVQKMDLSSASVRITRRSRAGGFLVALQVALTCMLLAVGGLFLRSLEALQHPETGFNPRGLATLVLAPQDAHKPSEASRQTLTQLLERFSAIPGVQSAMMQTSLPFSNYQFVINSDLDISGRVYQRTDTAFFSMVSTNFVRSSGLPLLRGRDFQRTDESSRAVTGLVNESFVRRYLPDRNPLAVQIKFHPHAEDKESDLPFPGPLTIIGVVRNEIQGEQLGAEFQPMVYLNYHQPPAHSPLTQLLSLWPAELAVRSSLPQEALNKELRLVLKEVAPDMTEMNLQPMETAIQNSLGQRRLALRLVSGFGVVALILTSIGLYGVLASFVGQRKREIGIRAALGSTRAGTTRLVARQAGGMMLVGLVLGIIGLWPAAGAVRSFLYGVEEFDPYVLVSAAVMLLVVGVLATIVPAWRAARLDPSEVLRSE